MGTYSTKAVTTPPCSRNNASILLNPLSLGMCSFLISAPYSTFLKHLGNHFQTLLSPLLKVPRIVLLSSLLWWELGTSLPGPGERLSFWRVTSKQFWFWPGALKGAIRCNNEVARACLNMNFKAAVYDRIYWLDYIQWYQYCKMKIIIKCNFAVFFILVLSVFWTVYKGTIICSVCLNKDYTYIKVYSAKIKSIHFSYQNPRECISVYP